jgi:hypothetical protein
MTLTSIFKYLGAPLANSRWSWGAVRPVDGAVFLRVWQDEVRKSGQRYWARVTAIALFQGDEGNLGFAERMRHVELIKGGASSFMIMCECKDVTSAPRAIAKFNEREVFVGGALEQADGEWWLEMVSRQPVRSVRR